MPVLEIKNVTKQFGGLTALNDVSFNVEEGEIIPLSMGSSGQVLDAYSIRQGKQATNIRKAGYYLSLGERDPDVAGLSVPVLGFEGEHVKLAIPTTHRPLSRPSLPL